MRWEPAPHAPPRPPHQDLLCTRLEPRWREMVLQQIRSLAFVHRLPPCRVQIMVATKPPTLPWVSQSAAGSSTSAGSRRLRARATPTTATALSALDGFLCDGNVRSNRSTRRDRRRRAGGTSPARRTRWAGLATSSRSLPSPPCQHKPTQQRGVPLRASRVGARRSLSASKSDGVEGIHGGVEEEGGGDGLLASLADELVWKGQEEDEEEEEYGNDDDDEDDEEEYETFEFEEGEALEGLDLESLGISMMDDESAEDVREQLRRQWGTVSVGNSQDEYQIDTAGLQSKLRQAMEVLGCQAWDVGAVLTTDEEVARLNRQYRGIKSSTDILSFPNNDMSDNPGVLPKVRFPAEMDLGDMFVSLAYVERQIKRDKREEDAAVAAAAAEGGVEEEEQEWWDGERGVSGAMARVFDVQERASMLLVHGLIHLLGYDHETQEDYEAMVAVEEEVLREVFGRQSIADARAPTPTDRSHTGE